MHLLAVMLSVLVYAPPSGKAGAHLNEAAQALRQSLRDRNVEVVEGAIDKARAERARGFVDEKALGFFGEGRAQLEEGRRALERAELGAAEAAFARAEKIYGAQLARPAVAQLMSIASRERGVAAWLAGRVADARVSFRRARVLDPGAQLTEAMVRPDVAKAFAEVAAQLRAQAGKSAVAVAVEPAGARVEIDGRVVSGSIDLDAGEHLARATCDGRLPWSQLVTVRAGDPIRIALAEDDQEAALAALKNRPAREGTTMLASSLGLDGVIAAAIAIDAGKLTWVGQRQTRAGCRTAVITRRSEGALVDELMKAPESCEEAALDGKQIVEAEVIVHPRPEPIVVPPPPPKRKPKIYERPWLWLGVFAGASLVVGLAAGLAPRGTDFAANVDASKFSLSR